MNHYFTNNSTLKIEIYYFSYTFKNKEYKFISDNGLFSKEHVDYASNLLINNIGELNGSLLDMGCGYGTLGIVLAGAYNLTLTLADVNKKAVEFAKKNAKSNNVKAECIVSDCFENITKKYDNIVINPPIHAGKSVIYKMYEDACEHLNEEGRLLIVIQKKHGAESTNTKLREVFNNCNVLYKKKGFFIFECTNPKVIWISYIKQRWYRMPMKIIFIFDLA